MRFFSLLLVSFSHAKRESRRTKQNSRDESKKKNQTAQKKKNKCRGGGFLESERFVFPSLIKPCD